MDLTVVCPEEADTQAVAGRLAAEVKPGDVVVLKGGLGSGKTRFAGGLAAGLGVEEAVVSPSFVLMREYRSGFLPVIHVDVYRLGSINEFDDLDVYERASEGVLVIEWGDAVASALPSDVLTVEFEVGEHEERTLRFVPAGEWSSRDLNRVIN
ncbi:MAG TPA: tRNA (adenosine(37)-N6)-threonylcarbamoyltransferase complex ATPase subunit type 1 TsaE [Acidimicrobiia bacterium]|nr:tRNA (adenosine(37)-N6)-threonylcarbamoyltransferase complex ATPase subunit type 1 TsaE [Acidimicrobiia bacterium]